MADLIADYNLGQGDKIDLTELMFVPAGILDPVQAGYVAYNAATGVLTIDTDGAGAASAPVPVANVNVDPVGSTHPPQISIVYEDTNNLTHQVTIG